MNIAEMISKYGWEDNEFNRKLIEEINSKEQIMNKRVSTLINDIRSDIQRQQNIAKFKENDKIGLKKKS